MDATMYNEGSGKPVGFGLRDRIEARFLCRLSGCRLARVWSKRGNGGGRGRMEKLRVGIIGIGLYAFRVHAQDLLRSTRTELTAVARRDGTRLRAAQEHLGVPCAFTDWRRMLDEAPLDAVIVSTTHASHSEPAIAALERGLHVLVEKPLAASSRDAWAMVEAARRARRVLMVSYQNRLKGLFCAVKRTLADGRIGHVMQVSAVFSQPFTLPDEAHAQGILEMYVNRGLPRDFVFGDERNEGVVGALWRADVSEAGGGMFADTGSHFTDLALWFAGGGRAADVFAFSKPRDRATETCLNAQVRLDSGVLVSLSANSVAPGLTERSGGQFTIVGETGWVGCDMRQAWCEKDGVREAIAPDGEDLRPVEAWAAAVLDGAANPCPPAEAALTVAVTEAAYRSAATGVAISCAPPEGWGGD